VVVAVARAMGFTADLPPGPFVEGREDDIALGRRGDFGEIDAPGARQGELEQRRAADDTDFLDPVFLGLLASLFTPWGIATSLTPSALAIGTAAFAAKVAAGGAALAAAEVFMAKIRLFRVPELLAGSFLLAVAAVASSYFLAGPG